MIGKYPSTELKIIIHTLELCTTIINYYACKSKAKAHQQNVK